MLTREDFAVVLRDTLYKKKITLSEFAARMTQAGVKTSYQQAYRWKKGVTLPNALQLVAICEVLQIRDVAKTFSGQAAKKLLQQAQEQAAREAVVISFDEERISHRQLPVILQKASAGTGQYVDDADMEMVYVRESTPENANFGIYVAGDSMEPKFHNGDLVWAERKDALASGEIGIFYLDGNIYLKKLEYGSDGVWLKSLSKRYQPIPIRETSVFRVWGKVLGVQQTK